MHRWWVLLHVAGAFGFVMAHGVSAYVTLRLPRERDPARVSQLLELSASSVGFMWNAIGVLLLGGIVAGFTGHFWGQGWIWAAIVVLVVVMVAMYAMATTWATRLRTISTAMVEGTEAVSREQYEEILGSRRPYSIAAIGFVGHPRPALVDDLQADARLRGRPRTSARPARTPCACAPSTTPGSCRATSRPPRARRSRSSSTTRTRAFPHNVAIYRDESAEESLFVGDLVDGPTTATYDVPALDAGDYYFRCDVHPAMNGTLEVS